MNEYNVSIRFTLNGRDVAAEVPVQRVMADFLRDDMGMNGVRAGCGRTVCGACCVLLDGVPRAACSAFAFEADGVDVVTVEGLAGQDGTLDPVQQAFLDCGALQCGYCTPGMILLTHALLRADPAPDKKTIRDWISSNICRCTGYAMIVDAVEQAAARMRGGR